MSDIASMEDLHQTLLDQFDALVARRKTTADAEVKKAMLVEMDEILHRIDLTQNLLLVAATTELKDALKEVEAGDASLTKELEEVADLAKFIKSMAKFLGGVDKAIDIAKKIVLL